MWPVRQCLTVEPTHQGRKAQPRREAQETCRAALTQCTAAPQPMRSEKTPATPVFFCFVRPTWVLDQSGLMGRREQWENVLYDK